MADTILGSVDGKAVNQFRKDLLEMLRIGNEIDLYYADSNSDIDVYIKKFEKLIKSFNKKYENLTLKLVKKTETIELRVFLNEKNVKDAFANSASKIIGVQSIGASKFGVASVSEAEKFANELEKAKIKLHITYFNPQSGAGTIFLQYDNKAKKIQLVYDIEEIENEPSAEFQLAAFYALSKGYNKKIKIHDEATTLGFSSIPDHLVKRKSLEGHDPHFSE